MARCSAAEREMLDRMAPLPEVARVEPTQAQIDAGARAVWSLCGGSLPWGKPRRGRNQITVSCQAVAHDVLAAAFNTNPGHPDEQSLGTEGRWTP